MRRLAKQTRDDVYSSRRDYQTVIQAQGLLVRAPDKGPGHLVLRADVVEEANTPFVGFGGYFRSKKATNLEITIQADDHQASRTFSLGKHWSRAGVAMEAPGAKSITVELSWNSGAALNFWGASAGALELPDAVLSAGIDELNKTHLAPETFYLPHEGVLDMTVVDEDSTAVDIISGAKINLKKCSYCGRTLPLDRDRPGTLAFHTHRDKKTGHQNECRACKKWRINDDFNPKRTVDQLHESSVITRERQIFLRDPERLQLIKDRTGAGLKSQVWERFGRRCFFCKRELELREVQLDHTRPLAYLWPIDEHATCLCAEHNNQKQDKFPCDFYTDEQLQQLAAIINLPYEKLIQKDINVDELQRILDELPTFARQWEPRTFAATARKVIEMRPDIDLFERLQQIDPEAAEELDERLANRPPPVA